MWHYNILCTPKGQSELDTERISKAYAAVRAAIIVVRWFRVLVFRADYISVFSKQPVKGVTGH